MALTVTGMGGLGDDCGHADPWARSSGSYDLSVILQNRDLIQADPLYLRALILILLGCFTKSAQFPFHFWLPHAMAAPTPVSAYLALGHDGEGGDLPDGADVARALGYARMVYDRDHCWLGHHGSWGR